VIAPCAIDGPTITIRKFKKDKLTVDQLISFGSLTKSMADFIRACVISRLNIVISGGTGSGKTTLLNVLSSFIPEDERIITIEDAAELKLQQDHVVRLETKPANIEGKHAVTIRDLVKNSLRMRPDRIVVGECRGGETLDMLQAMNTGHDGSLTTLHANTPRDALSRMETMCLMSGMDMPIKVIREQIASAIDVIIQQSRLKDGSRKVTYVTEVAGMEGDTVTLTDIFKFEQTALSTDGKVIGELKPTGIRPLFSPRLEAAGFKLGPEVFGANLSDMFGPRRK
jgi:pilus assembly protein CpaF